MATKAEKLFKKGQAQEQKGNLKKAWKQYRSACDHAKYDPEVWLARANVAESLEEKGDAVESLFYVADLYVRGGMPREALRVAERVIELDPKHGGARRFISLLERKLTRVKAEIEAQEKIANELEAKPEERAESEAAVLEFEAEPPSQAEIEAVAEAEPSFDVEPELPAAVPDAIMDRARTDSGAVAKPIHGKSKPYRAEYRVGRTTGDIALDEIKLAEVLKGHRPRSETGEIEIDLDDEEDVDVVQAVAATISSSPLLSELDSDLMKTLVDVGTLVHRSSEDLVFAEGDHGNSLFLILKGRVAVERANDRGDIQRLAVLRAGAFFGEMALLTNAPRSASVRAVVPVDLLEISRDDVRGLVDRDGRVLKLLMRFFRARLVGTLMAMSPLFEAFNRDQRRSLISRFRLRELRAGHLVLKMGERSEGLYLVLMGHLQVFTGGAISDPKVLGTLVPGDVFGEMSLLDGKGAMANVRTQGRSWVLMLPREDFAALVAEHPNMLEQLSLIADRRRTLNEDALAQGIALPPAERVKPV